MIYSLHTLKTILPIILMFYASQITAATFTYSGGQLIGASGVEVLGATWNVTFHTGSFNDVDDLYGLSSPFFSFDDSQALAQALAADMSVLEGVLGPDDVNGCTAFNVGCGIVTPYTFTTSPGDLPLENLRVTGFSAVVSPSNTIDGSATTTAKRDIDFAHITYAVWEGSVVPVPAAVWLFSSGLIGLVGFAKRRKS